MPTDNIIFLYCTIFGYKITKYILISKIIYTVLFVLFLMKQQTQHNEK